MLLKKKSIFVLVVSLVGLAYLAYRKIVGYIFLNSDNSDEIFGAIKSKQGSFGHLFMYIGIVLILVSLIGIFGTFRHFSVKPRKIRGKVRGNSNNFEDIL